MGAGPSKPTSAPQGGHATTNPADNDEPATIVIAGGGIVGLVLAMSLKKQLGVIPEIYEKTHTFDTEAGGE